MCSKTSVTAASRCGRGGPLMAGTPLPAMSSSRTAPSLCSWEASFVLGVILGSSRPVPPSSPGGDFWQWGPAVWQSGDQRATVGDRAVRRAAGLAGLWLGPVGTGHNTIAAGLQLLIEK